MPMFEIEANGKRYEVEAPDARAAVDALGQMSTPPPSIGEDVVKSGASGLGEGLTGLAGLPGDVADLTRSAGTFIGNKLRSVAGKEPIDQAPDPIGLSDIPGKQDIESAIGFEPYKPKTTPGKFARTIGEFIPAAASLGVGGGLRGMTTSAAKYGAAPGAASELAGQATEGTYLEPIARIAAPIAAAGGIAAASKTPQLAAPSLDDLGSAAGSIYKQADQMGVVLAPQSFQGMTHDLARSLHSAGANHVLHPRATAAFKEIVSTMDSGKPVSLGQMERLRRIANGALSSMEKDERRIAHMIVDKIDDYMAGLGQIDVVSGNPVGASKVLRDARQLWTQKSKGETIARIFEKAKNAVGANYTAAGMQTALRQKFRALADNEKAFRRFSKAEQEAILKVVRGGKVENLMRFFGKFAPRGFFSGGALATIGYINPSIGIPYFLASEGAKRGATNLSLRNADMVDAMVRAGKTVPRPPNLNFMQAPLMSGFAATRSDPTKPRQ